MNKKKTEKAVAEGKITQEQAEKFMQKHEKRAKGAREIALKAATLLSAVVIAEYQNEENKAKIQEGQEGKE